MDSAPSEDHRILVVDDERIQRLLLTRGVETLGFHADAVADLAEAARLLSERRYEVILLDLALGESEGVSLLQAVRESGCDPVVIFVSRLDERLRTACMRLASALGLRVAGTLQKPLSLPALRTLLAENPVREAPACAT